MMKMKRILLIALCVSMLATLLVGCGKPMDFGNEQMNTVWSDYISKKDKPITELVPFESPAYTADSIMDGLGQLETVTDAKKIAPFLSMLKKLESSLNGQPEADEATVAKALLSKSCGASFTTDEGVWVAVTFYENQVFSFTVASKGKTDSIFYKLGESAYKTATDAVAALLAE